MLCESGRSVFQVSGLLVIGFRADIDTFIVSVVLNAIQATLHVNVTLHELIDKTHLR